MNENEEIQEMNTKTSTNRDLLLTIPAVDQNMGKSIENIPIQERRHKFVNFLKQGNKLEPPSTTLIKSVQNPKRRISNKRVFSVSCPTLLPKRSIGGKVKNRWFRKVGRNKQFKRETEFIEDEENDKGNMFGGMANSVALQEEMSNELNLLNTDAATPKSDIAKLRRSSKHIRQMVQLKHKTKIREALNINTWVILPQDTFKSAWGAVVLILLMYATLITPYRIAFIETDTLVWIILDSFVDFCFLIDLILNMFFFAYYDVDEELIYDRKKIIKRYLKSWFIIDLLAIIPFSAFYGRNYNSLSRLARLPRLYKLLKITRILKTLRVCREKSNWMEYAPALSAAGERLIAFMLIILVLNHVSACLWFMLAKIEGLYPDSWVVRYFYQDSSNFEIYTASFYFIITTITTVGYGDISPNTTWERWFATIIMVVGVMSYSFMISSLSSLFTSKDIQQTNKNIALDSLRRIDVSNNLDTGLFLRLKKSIIKKFKEVEYIKNRDALMHLLPRKLRGDLNSAMHESLVRKILIFKHEDSKFVEQLARLLKPRKYTADEIICGEGTKIDEIYFIIKGSVEYVLPEFNNIPYKRLKKGERFGDLEIVHLFLQGQRLSEGRRIFTAKAKEDSEILVLSQTDLLILYHKFEKQIESIFNGADFRLKHTQDLKSKIETNLKRRFTGMTKIVRRMSKTIAESDPKLPTGYSTKQNESDNDEVRGSNIEEEEDEEDEEESDSMYTEISDYTNMSDYLTSLAPMQEEIKKESSQMSSKGNQAQNRKIPSRRASKIKATSPTHQHKTPMRRPSSPNFNIKKRKHQSFLVLSTNRSRDILSALGGIKREGDVKRARAKECSEKRSINSSPIKGTEKEETNSLAPNVDENIETLIVPATVSKSKKFPIMKMSTVSEESKEEGEEIQICTK